MSLLERLRPRPELVSLFRAIVLDVWKARKEDVTALRAAAERKMADLKRRKDQLVEAFIFQKVIDEATYKDQLGKLNEAMALAEIDQHDHRSDELDIEAVLDFAEKVSLDAPRLWLEANLDQRQRFQSFLFPEGLKVAEGEIRTPVTASFYEELQHFTGPGTFGRPTASRLEIHHRLAAGGRRLEPASGGRESLAAVAHYPSIAPV